MSGAPGWLVDLLAFIEKLYETYPGTVTVLGTLFAGLALISPGISASFKLKRAEAQNQPAPKQGAWAAAVLKIGALIRGIVTRLRTDPVEAGRKLAEANQRIGHLELRAGRLANIVAARKQVIPTLRRRVQELEDELEDAKSEIARLNMNAIRARGMDAQANQASFAKMKPTLPPAAWKVARTASAGKLQLLNVGGGPASNVMVTTNYPLEVTLSDAYAEEAPPKFAKDFYFEPINMLENFDLEFQIDWWDEVGVRRQEVKKAVG